MVYIATAKYSDNPNEEFGLTESWNYKTGDKILVQLYTNQPEAELFLNGKSLSLKSELNCEGCMEWIVDYEAGELKAIAGKISTNSSDDISIVEFSLRTTGNPAKLALVHWTTDNQQECFIYEAYPVYQIEITVVDENNLRIINSDLPVTVQISGNGELLGLENGNLSDNTPYSSSHRNTFEGRMIAYVRRIGDGKIELSAYADGLPKEKIIIN